MVRKMILGAMLALALVGAVCQAQACEACAAKPERFEGKLVKVVASRPLPDVFDKNGKGILDLPVHVHWVLQSGKKTYTLDLTTRTLVRLAATLDGQDVVVTGERKGDTISVSDLAAKKKPSTGTLTQDKDGRWWLTNGKERTGLVIANKTHSRRATELVGKRVRVTGQMAISGIVVTSIEADSAK
jgi:hypothetical protein